MAENQKIQVITPKEFANFLRKQDLIIVSRKELERIAKVDVFLKRNELLKRKFLTISEVLQLDVLPVKSRKTIERWIDSGVFKANEVTQDRSGKKVILTSSLSRLGYV
jgi:hypothetical protein